VHIYLEAGMLQEEKSGDAPPKKDESEVKSIAIPGYKIDDGVVFYHINVDSAHRSWSVVKRYSQFEELQASLLQSELAKHVPVGCELPPKRFKIFVSHLSPAFIEERRVLLEAYAKKLILVKELAAAALIERFFSSDKQESRAEVKESPARPDDIEVTSVTIPATRTMSDHVLYQIDVSNSKRRKSFSKWTVLKRFTQFFDMDSLVRAAFAEQPEILEKLPPPPERKTKLFNDHMDEVFIEQRRVLLENYLNRMLECEDVARNKDFLLFLGVT